MKQIHLLLLAVFLTISLWGCHSNNTPPVKPTVGGGKEGITHQCHPQSNQQCVPLPNFVRPNEAQPNGVNEPCITLWLDSNQHLQYTITDDEAKTWGPFSLPSSYAQTTFGANFNASAYNGEAKVTGATTGKTFYTKCRPDRPYRFIIFRIPEDYDVDWLTSPP
jgi:hypothetical protein